METIAYYDGQIGQPEDLWVPFNDRSHFFGDGVCFVEWANLVDEIMPEETTWVTIEKDLGKGFDYRKISIR